MKRWPTCETAWCFALVNNRLSEIWFKVGKGAKGVFAHCYVDDDKFNKTEQKMIKEDIKRHQFSYRKGKYRSKLPG